MFTIDNTNGIKKSSHNLLSAQILYGRTCRCVTNLLEFVVNFIGGGLHFEEFPCFVKFAHVDFSAGITLEFLKSYSQDLADLIVGEESGDARNAAKLGHHFGDYTVDSGQSRALGSLLGRR